MTEQSLDSRAQGLLERVRSTQSIVVCVGAGASVAAGAPTWTSLSRSLLERLAPDQRTDVERFLSASDPQDMLVYLRNTLGYEVLAEALRGARGADSQPSELHRALAALPSATFVTTNFDTLIEDSLEEAGRATRTVVADDDLTQLPSDLVPVLKLHGSINRPATLVFSSRDSDRQQRSRMQTYLMALLSSSVVLFVGFSLQGSDLPYLFQTYRGPTDTPADWIVIAPRGNPFTSRLWESRGVRVIELESKQLPNFIRAIGSRLKRPLPKPPAVGRAMRVFLSHGRDLRLASAARRAAQSLGCEIVSIADAPSMGQTIHERFAQLTESASAAIVILTPEEVGHDRTDITARQNNVFELGLLVGKLGARHVFVVVSSESVRPPTDLAGLEFIVGDPEHPEALENTLRQWLGTAKRDVPPV